MKIRALNDRVVIRRDSDQDETSHGGILLPDSAKTPRTRGVVISVGPLCKKVDGVPLLRVGDRVFFDKYSGSERDDGGHGHIVPRQGGDLIVMREDDILGIIEEL